jgi:hypothetical protein
MQSKFEAENGYYVSTSEPRSNEEKLCARENYSCWVRQVDAACAGRGGRHSRRSSPKIRNSKLIPQPSRIIGLHRVGAVNFGRVVFERLKPSNNLAPIFCAPDCFAWRHVPEHRNGLIEELAIMFVQIGVNNELLLIGRYFQRGRGWL